MSIKTRYKGEEKPDESVVTPGASKPRYDGGGVRLDNPSGTPEPVKHGQVDGVERVYRGKLVIFPEGRYEVMVTRPSQESIEAMGRTIRPCDMPPKPRTEDEQAKRDVEKRERACRRATQRVRFLVKCIGADHLVTPCYREVMQDVEKLKRDFKEFHRLVNVRYPEWRYVAVFEKQRADKPDWSYHLHLAVRGKQDIRWLLRCWLRAIGQPIEEVDDWYVRGVKLGEKSLGSVNVRGPDRKYGNKSIQWKADRLSSYLTKYISKEFIQAAKNSKKYWHPQGIQKPEVIRLWLGATNYPAAIREAHDMLYFRGVTHFDRMYGSDEFGIVWMTASTERKHIGQCTQGVPDLDVELIEHS